MDYADAISYRTHAKLERFVASHRQAQRRLVLLSARAHEPYHRFVFAPNDTLVLGSESQGAPPSLEPDAALRIPMRVGLRSLNVVTAAAMVLGEALRQLDSWPEMDERLKASRAPGN